MDAEVVNNFNNADGYYHFILGELLDNGQYHVHANLGKGMFVSIVCATDMSAAKDGIKGAGSNVAIKVGRKSRDYVILGSSHTSCHLQVADGPVLNLCIYV
jgi:serine/threonine-protein kinase PRP4